MEYVRLTHDRLGRHLEEVQAIDRDTLAEAWEAHHYQSELPGKWEASWIALDGDRATGFVIASVKPASLHVHRLAVAGSERGKGIGRELLRRVARNAQEKGRPVVTLKVNERNEGAIQFYHRLGFQEVGAGNGNLSLEVDVARLLEVDG